jgi:methylated-DNA-[protein]-cysteine S-methyltransferase
MICLRRLTSIRPRLKDDPKDGESEPMRNREPNTFGLLVDSPMGWLRLEATDRGLVAMDWVRPGDVMSPAASSSAANILRQASRWLSTYFKQHSPPPLPPLSLAGTEFQKAVWQCLAALPAGRLTTYGEIAHEVGSPRACRAVGQAVGANPLPIFIPCHRVLAAGGQVGGYSAGLPRKRWLLAHEGLSLPTRS